MNKITTLEMEIILAKYFNYTQNIIVPNVSWGIYLNGDALHECDLLVLTKSRYLWEVEIKISLPDLRADKKKIHGHINKNIKRLYFAIPEYLVEHIDEIPERSGIIIVKENGYCYELRKPVNDKGYKLTKDESFKLLRLGSMRIWTLKQRLLRSEQNGL